MSATRDGFVILESLDLCETHAEHFAWSVAYELDRRAREREDDHEIVAELERELEACRLTCRHDCGRGE